MHAKKRTDAQASVRFHAVSKQALGYLPRLRLCRFRARSFLYLCLRIFFRRFLMTLPINAASDLARDGKRHRADVKRLAQSLPPNGPWS
jgi:hypothetical protein